MRFIILAIVAICIGLNQTNALQPNDACNACQKFSNFISNLTNNVDEELYDSLSKLCSDYSEIPRHSFCNNTVHALIDFLNQRWVSS
ncbi:saposin-like protein [Euroglyphus maynei]|uniref:Saposin-like protein n=1 Tax=Euroglyphus maynei TaxID=6958 RepID=A0A1Y3BP65_EURMA|nr:saposin-like protein [Euroglyphus maynei]